MEGDEMNRYLTLDLSNKEDALYFGNKFLADRAKWKKEIKEKKDELDSVRDLKAISNSEVHSGHISNPTQNSAFAAMRLEEEITRREDYETILTYGLNHISEEEKDILTALLYTKGRYTNAIIDDLAIKYDCDPRTIYNRRRTAVLNFVEAIRGIID